MYVYIIYDSIAVHKSCTCTVVYEGIGIIRGSVGKLVFVCYKNMHKFTKILQKSKKKVLINNYMCAFIIFKVCVVCVCVCVLNILAYHIFCKHFICVNDGEVRKNKYIS